MISVTRESATSLPTWKYNLLKELLRKKGAPLYLATPKTGSRSVRAVCRRLKIENSGHNARECRNQQSRLRFTVIRHPVKRFESFLHYRLQAKEPRRDWKARRIPFNKHVELDRIVNKLSNQQIRHGFAPFGCQTDYMSAVDISFTLEEIPYALAIMKNLQELPKLPHKNRSSKTNPPLSNECKRRLARALRKDIKLYKKWSRKE